MRSALILALALTAAACNAPPAAPPPAAQADSAVTAPETPAAETTVTPAVETAAPTAEPAAAGKAVPWKIDAAHSSIHFSVNHKVYGALGANFKSWTAKITFDPADLAHSSATVTIPMDGVKLGTPDADSAWPTAEWADVAHHPTVTFTSTGFKSLGGDKYQALGTLNVKGRATPITMPFTLKMAGNQADVLGAVSLDRTKLDIGMQTDPGGDWVDKTISVTVKVRATKG